MKNEKIMALAQFLECEPEQITVSKHDKNLFYYKEDGEKYGEEYYVFDDYDEAEEAAKQDVIILFDDMGLQSFSDWGRDYVIDNFMDEDFLSDALRENFESYVDDIRSENGYHYANRMIDEAVEAGILSEEDAEEENYDEDDVASNLIDHFCEEWEGREAEYFESNFGSLEDAFGKETVEAHIDTDAMADWCVREDGVGSHLNRWDGREYEEEYEGTTYYIYGKPYTGDRD